MQINLHKSRENITIKTADKKKVEKYKLLVIKLDVLRK